MLCVLCVCAGGSGAGGKRARGGNAKLTVTEVAQPTVQAGDSNALFSASMCTTDVLPTPESPTTRSRIGTTRRPRDGEASARLAARFWCVHN